MAELQGDNASNSAGNGPINFPFGLTTPGGAIAANTFTAVIAGLANIVSAPASAQVFYMRLGNFVIAYGTIGGITTGAANTITKLLVDLPFPVIGSPPAATGHCTVYNNSSANFVEVTAGVVTGGGATQMIIQWNATNGGLLSTWYSYMYQIA